MIKKLIYTLIYSLPLVLVLAACEIDNRDADAGQTAVPASDAGTEPDSGIETPAPVVPQRPPVSAESVPESGEYVPDPVLVKYEFIFADGTVLAFKENHSGDYWGDMPSAGWGQITNPDGSTRGVDVNSIVRKGGLSRARTPVTTPDHGRRLFWMADSEGTPNVKKVTIFEDGWNPLVEGAVLATLGGLQINSHILTCQVRVERRK